MSFADLRLGAELCHFSEGRLLHRKPVRLLSRFARSSGCVAARGLPARTRRISRARSRSRHRRRQPRRRDRGPASNQASRPVTMTRALRCDLDGRREQAADAASSVGMQQRSPRRESTRVAAQRYGSRCRAPHPRGEHGLLAIPAGERRGRGAGRPAPTQGNGFDTPPLPERPLRCHALLAPGGRRAFAVTPQPAETK